MASIDKMIYCLELFANAAKRDIIDLYNRVDNSNADSKKIRRQKKIIAENDTIDDELKEELKKYNFFYNYSESIDKALVQRKEELEILIKKYSDYSEILSKDIVSFARYYEELQLHDVLKYFNELKNIYIEELNNIQNHLVNNDEPDIKIVDGVLWSVNGNKPEIEILNDVKEIKSFAFYMNPYIKRVRIMSENINNINPMTFAFCPNLEEIIFGKNIKIFDRMAIYNCPKLDFLELPNEIEKINNDSISFCAGLFCLLKNEGKYIVENNTLIEDNNIILTANLPILPSIENLYSFSIVNNSNLALLIPNSVKRIHTASIVSSNICELMIPESVESIDSMAIIDCQNLSRIIILNKNILIDGRTFAFCPNLKEIICPKELEAEAFKLTWPKSDTKIIYY